MIPTDFFKEIVTPNVDALGNDVGDLRHAVNAILSLDALAGIIHADLYARGAGNCGRCSFPGPAGSTTSRIRHRSGRRLRPQARRVTEQEATAGAAR